MSVSLNIVVILLFFLSLFLRLLLKEKTTSKFGDHEVIFNRVVLMGSF